MFEFYTKVEEVEIGEHLALNTSTMQYRAFVKFASQMRLVPTLISNEEVVMIYKLIMKDKSANTEEPEKQKSLLTYEEFLEALVRVAIRGRGKLGKTKLSEMGSKKPVGTGNMLFFDVKEIGVDTLEGLMRCLELAPTEKRAALMQRLVELQHEGVKAGMMKKRLALSPPEEPEQDAETEEKEETENGAKNQETQMSGSIEGSPDSEGKEKGKEK